MPDEDMVTRFIRARSKRNQSRPNALSEGWHEHGYEPPHNPLAVPRRQPAHTDGASPPRADGSMGFVQHYMERRNAR